VREKNRNSIGSCLKLPQFTTMNVIDGQAGQIIYTSLIFYSLTIDNILNIIVLLILAGVAISMLSGENGILKQAAEAKEKTEEKGKEERETLLMQTLVIEETTSNPGETIGEKLHKLEKAVKEYGLEEDFDFNSDLLYKGKNEDLKEIILENYVVYDLVQKGFLFSCVDGETFITGITDKTESYNKIKEIKDGEEEQKYIVEDQNGDEQTTVYTSYILKFNNDQEDKKTPIGTVIFYNGDVDLNGEIKTEDATKISDFVQDPFSEVFEEYALYQKYAMDVNHDGVINNEDDEIVEKAIRGEVDFINNIKVTKLNQPKKITEKEAIISLGIAKDNKIVKEELLNDVIIYTIDLKEEYCTYGDLKEQIESELLNETITFYDLNWSEITISDSNANQNIEKGKLYICIGIEGYIRQEGKSYIFTDNSYIYLNV